MTLQRCLPALALLLLLLLVLLVTLVSTTSTTLAPTISDPILPYVLPTIQVLAIIPARSGSVSVPHKNIRDFAGKPLLAHSIAHALAATTVTRVLVSTDSEDYRTIALEYGAEAPFLRPSKFAGNDETDLSTFEHALSWLKTNEDYVPDYVVHLRATCPLRNPADIDRAVLMLVEAAASDDSIEYDSVRSVKKVDGPHPWRMWIMEEATLKDTPPPTSSSSNAAAMRPLALPPGFSVGQAGNSPRQLLPAVYVQDSCVEVVSPRVILQEHSMTGSRVLGIVLGESVDIDTEQDFQRAVQQVMVAASSLKDATQVIHATQVIVETQQQSSCNAIGDPVGCSGGGRLSISPDSASYHFASPEVLRAILSKARAPLYLSNHVDISNEIKSALHLPPDSLYRRFSVDTNKHVCVQSGPPLVHTGPDRCGEEGLRKSMSVFAELVDSSKQHVSLGRCAVIGSSGILTGAGYGSEINSHDTVMRFNHAPTSGYEVDVGSKTSYRILGGGLNYDPSLLATETSTVLWYPCHLWAFAVLEELLVQNRGDLPGPVSRTRLQAIPLSFLIEVANTYLNKNGSQPFERSYGDKLHKVARDNPAPSSGLVGTLWALRMCDSVNLYGFGFSEAASTWYYAASLLDQSHAALARVRSEQGVKGVYEPEILENESDLSKSQYHDWKYEHDLLQDLHHAGLISLHK